MLDVQLVKAGVPLSVILLKYSARNCPEAQLVAIVKTALATLLGLYPFMNAAALTVALLIRVIAPV